MILIAERCQVVLRSADEC